MGRLAGIVLMAGLLAATGCGANAVRPAVAPPDTVATTLYFLTADRQAPLGVRPSIPRVSPYALQALRALLAGPTAGEQRAGVRTAIPEGVRLLDFRVEDSTRAFVELSGLDAITDAVDRVRVITQITRTVVGLSGIEDLRLRNRGQPWGLGLMSGGIADHPFDYDYLLGLQVCSAAPSTEAVSGDCFSALP